MKDWRSQAHVKWTCKYHVVILPKYRIRKFYGSLRSKVGQILRELCQQKGVELLEGKAMPDHIHLLLSSASTSLASSLSYSIGIQRPVTALSTEEEWPVPENPNQLTLFP